MSYNIALIGKDGIGEEILNSAKKVLNICGQKLNIEFNFKELAFGGEGIDLENNPLPNNTLKECKNSDAVLLGAVGGYKWNNLSGDKRPEAALLKIRKELQLFTNLRPAKLFDAIKNTSPLKEEKIANGIDLIIVRELIGGIYFGQKNISYINKVETAYDTECYDEKEIERITIKAFEIARSRRNKVTLVDKSNVLESSRLWKKVVFKIHKNYTDILLDEMYVDNASMQLILNPSSFDVILTSNMFGDILSDEASAICGSIGMAPSASLGNFHPYLYEAIHGSAPDIAGKDIANPIATILSVALMLKYSFNNIVAEKLVNDAVNQVLLDGYRTQDIYNNLVNEKLTSTSKITDLIVEKIKNY